MNAVRKTYEAPAMMSDPVEVHLTYLRAGLDEVKTALPVLRDKIDRTHERIEQVNSSLNEKIEKSSAALNEKLEKNFDKHGLQISKLIEGLAEVRSVQKAIFWVLGCAGTVAALASIATAARSFGLI